MSDGEDQTMTDAQSPDENTATPQPASITPGASEDVDMFEGDNEEGAEDDVNVTLPPCPHIREFVDQKALIPKSKSWKKWKILRCDRCRSQTHQTNLVLCLKCGKFFCSRASEAQHGVDHHQSTGHKICLMTEDKTIWCYACDAFMSEMGCENVTRVKKARDLVSQQINRINNKAAMNAAKAKNSKKGGNNRATSNRGRRGRLVYDEEFPRDWNAAEQMVVEDGVIQICGLRNLGNTCFFNSVVQNLCGARPFVRKLLDLKPHVEDDGKEQDPGEGKTEAKEEDPHTQGSPAQNTRSKTQARKDGTSKKGKKTKEHGRLMDEFTKLLRSMIKSKTRSVSPNDLHRAVAIRNKMFANKRQHDSHELLRTLVEGIRDQNANWISKQRKIRVKERVEQWTHEQMVDWFHRHDVEIEDDVLAKLSPIDFASFIRSPSKFDVPRFLAIVEMEKKEPRTKHLSACIHELNAERCEFYKAMYEGVDSRTEHEEQTVIDDVFRGKMQSSVTCQECGTVSASVEEFYDLSLPIAAPEASDSVYGHYRSWRNKRSRKGKNKGKGKRGRRRQESPTPPPPEEPATTSPTEKKGMTRLKPERISLEDAILAYTDPEMLEGRDAYGCWECTKRELNITSDAEDEKDTSADDEFSDRSHLDAGDHKVDLVKKPAVKRYLLSHAPTVLTFHLKRFEQRGYRVTKTSKTVDFEVEIDLSDVATEDCRNDMSCRYRLFGISRHMGNSMGGGHYVAYTRKNRSQEIGHGWYYISDSHFRACDLKEVLSSEAYLLFYERIDDFDDTAVSEGNEKAATDAEMDDVSEQREDDDGDIEMSGGVVVSGEEL